MTYRGHIRAGSVILDEKPNLPDGTSVTVCVFDLTAKNHPQYSSTDQHLKTTPSSPKHTALHEHPAFGSWRDRQIDAVEYQRALRSEWD